MLWIKRKSAAPVTEVQQASGGLPGPAGKEQVCEAGFTAPHFASVLAGPARTVVQADVVLAYQSFCASGREITHKCCFSCWQGCCTRG